jgi:(1->4)-alpha-D-glucan 1-alpha-D-glucosylmutase
MIKAVREAKVYTEWLKPDAAYEEGFLSFIDAVLASSNGFLGACVPFARKVAQLAILNSLSQTLVKIASPGVPDFFQGTELWELSFVDPDNRQPVDFRRRRKLLDKLKKRETEDRMALLRDLLLHWSDGSIKLYSIYKALHFRRAHQRLFQQGTYRRLFASGNAKDHICAFARQEREAWALVIAPRLTTAIVGRENLPLGRESWGDSALLLSDDFPNRWQNVFTAETLEASESHQGRGLSLAEALQNFPVALLAPAESEAALAIH